VAVLTGLRPSEQVALKWQAIDGEFLLVELSRVRNHEKRDLKTEASRREIQIRPGIQRWLEEQYKMTAHFKSPYIFLNTEGRPILQDKLRELWVRVMKKSGVVTRRMYETRHTFASWALGAGESPHWVARTLGHVDTSMVYRTYGRYIPNLTHKDGSALEEWMVRASYENVGTILHGLWHNRPNLGTKK
jgi:integrase